MASDKETAPLLPVRTKEVMGVEKTDGGKFRFNRTNTMVLVTAVCGMLAFYGGDVLTNIGGVGVSGEDDAAALALSPSFVEHINARNMSWTASIPAGWENARHSDLKRIAGGRLSKRPRSDLWQTSEYASVGTSADAVSAEVKRQAGKRVAGAKRAPSLGQSRQQSRGFGFGAYLSGNVAGVGQTDRGNMGGFIEDFIGGPQPVGEEKFDPEGWGLPTYFDSRKKWPACAALIGGGRDQGNCGSCWAMAPAEVMSDRMCIQSNGKRAVELSPYELLACATNMAQGCDGGESTVAYEYAKTVGIVSGAKNGDTATCAPYPFAACEHPCTVFPTPQCPETCENGLDITKEKVRVRKITDCPSFDFKCLAHELYNNGPVSSYAGDIYEEFYAYSDGVYKESPDINARGQNHGGHVIKVIGWGKDHASGEYYWIIVNSWLNWGQNGVGRVAVGEVGIGAGVEAAVMDV